MPERVAGAAADLTLKIGSAAAVAYGGPILRRTLRIALPQTIVRRITTDGGIATGIDIPIGIGAGEVSWMAPRLPGSSQPDTQLHAAHQRSGVVTLRPRGAVVGQLQVIVPGVVKTQLTVVQSDLSVWRVRLLRSGDVTVTTISADDVDVDVDADLAASRA